MGLSNIIYHLLGVHGCPSKVTLLQALLRKAFRSPGVLSYMNNPHLTLPLPSLANGEKNQSPSQGAEKFEAKMH